MSSYIHSFEDLMPERTLKIIQKHFIDNLEPLQEGVQYLYKGRIWTIKLVLILDENRNSGDHQLNVAKKVFCLVHSIKNSYVYIFTRRRHSVVAYERRMVRGYYLISNKGRMPILDTILNSKRCEGDVEAPKVSTYRQNYFLNEAGIEDIPESIFL
ncbi:MAG: hypothetical protein K1060chlam2_00996 [Chlamydiae bacterium]|nr:hypothetical protein [Chlamydiota bacterium]